MRRVATYPEPPYVDLELYLPTYSESLALYGSRAGALAGRGAAGQRPAKKILLFGKFGFKMAILSLRKWAIFH